MSLLSKIQRIAYLVILSSSPLSAAGPEAPIVWSPPAGFDPGKDGLGLPQLPGVSHTTIYDPQLEQPLVGLDGKPAPQGWLNHHARLLRLGNHLVVTWTSHLSDENAPGQRVLACTALIGSDGEIHWSPTIVEVGPSPVPMKPRGWNSHPDLLDGPFVVGRLAIIKGRLYFSGALPAYDGWTDEVGLHGGQRKPIPADRYRLEMNRETNFRYDIMRDLKLRFIQAWEFRGNELVPASPMYLLAPAVKSIEVTPGRFKPVIPLNETYRNAPSIGTAPEAIQQAATAKPDVSFERPLPYPPGKGHLAADGFNGLAHWAEFRRPDGKWVVVRDNLEKRGFYYAALKPDAGAEYPPAVRTNLFGDVDADAGELPDGRVWLIGNDLPRVHLYLTLSNDGIHFDRTWLLRHDRIPLKPGLGKTTQPNGPQYPHVLQLEDRLIVAYSIGKQRIGVSVVPLESLR